MATLKSKVIAFKKSENLIKEYAGCGINSMMLILDNLHKGHNIEIDHIKKIFDYDSEEGIRLEKYRFNKLNSLLNKNDIPTKFYMRSFNSWQELLALLDTNQPLPVFFSMKIINFIKDKFKYSGVVFNFGNVYMDDNQHLLLFMGYDLGKDILYFIDPVYQLPYYSQKDLEDKNKLIALKPKQFYECTRYTKAYIDIKRRVVKKKTEKNIKLNSKKW